MAKKAKKNAETAAAPKPEETKPEVQTATVSEGVTTEEKKALENSPVIPETTDPKPEVVPEKKRPDYPGADFCMEPTGNGQKIWESMERIFDPDNGTCKTCLTDYPATYASCKERHEMMMVKLPKGKGRAAGAGRKSADGKPAQTKFIDDLLKQGVPIKEIGEKLGVSHYGGVVKSGTDRTSRHLKSIKDGSYIKAKEMQPYLAAYDKKPEQPAATAATN